MTIRLLAVIPEAATTKACLDAADLARRALEDASVEALHVVVDPEHLIVASEEIDFQQLRIRHGGAAHQREEATREVFDTWVSSHPDSSPQWKTLIGAEEENVEIESRRFDVLVIARATNMDGGDALHAALRRSRRPLILVPSKWSPEAGADLREHVVIAWNDTDQCTRAAQGAIPWLRRAKKVTILLVDERGEIADHLKDILERERIVFGVHGVIRDNDISLGEQIVVEARQLGAAMLVMGAYRHNEFIEWLLGGTTRHAIAQADLPLFLAH